MTLVSYCTGFIFRLYTLPLQIWLQLFSLCFHFFTSFFSQNFSLFTRDRHKNRWLFIFRTSVWVHHFLNVRIFDSFAFLSMRIKIEHEFLISRYDNTISAREICSKIHFKLCSVVYIVVVVTARTGLLDCTFCGNKCWVENSSFSDFSPEFSSVLSWNLWKDTKKIARLIWEMRDKLNFYYNEVLSFVAPSILVWLLPFSLFPAFWTFS